MTFVPAEPVHFAQTPDGVVVVRVYGKGTHLQSSSLRFIFEKTRKNEPPPRYVIDLDHCTTLDSTFMGTLASMALHQRRTTGSSLIVTNVQDHVRYLLETLGLRFILELRQGRDEEARRMQRGAFKPAKSPELSAVDRIVMMIEAHENLADLDGENEIKFDGVLKSLRESLERAKDHPAE
jgi:anti-anti-sigma regulatory factor